MVQILQKGLYITFCCTLMGLFVFKTRVTWLLIDFIRNIVIFFLRMINFLCCKFFITTTGRVRILSRRADLHWYSIWSSNLYCRFWKELLFFIKYFGNLVCLLTWGGSVSCLMWYGIHIEKGVWERICYTSKDTDHHLIFNMVYLGSSWIWRIMIIFQSLLHTISRLPGFLDK